MVARMILRSSNVSRFDATTVEVAISSRQLKCVSVLVFFMRLTFHLAPLAHNLLEQL